MKRNYKLYVYFILMILWITFIFSNSLEVADISGNHSAWVKELLNTILSYIPFIGKYLVLSDFVVRKLAHMFEFFVLAILCAKVLLSIKPKYNKHIMLVQVLFVMGIALIDECIQLFVPGRAGSIIDVLIDTSGALIAIVLMSIYYVVKYHLKEGKK